MVNCEEVMRFFMILFLPFAFCACKQNLGEARGLVSVSAAPPVPDESRRPSINYIRQNMILAKILRCLNRRCSLFFVVVSDRCLPITVGKWTSEMLEKRPSSNKVCSTGNLNSNSKLSPLATFSIISILKKLCLKILIANNCFRQTCLHLGSWNLKLLALKLRMVTSSTSR
jgi:hypothetical protein